MAKTIDDLYLKYVNRVSKTLETDKYFQYLFEMVQAGKNELSQRHQIMHKIVDERWLSTIEDSLDAIYSIIEKPRRFVTTEQEVVPVALARKITADSVMHLSMNTQYIASNEDGDVHPTRVLNVTTKESFDLYENRFIYHLIQRLVAFIDRRTDVIFWQTGDETKNTLTINSSIDDAYEQIDYKLELSIKNLQSYSESDNDHMELYMRIDRVRRLVHNLRSSSFCQLMYGCQQVRSPINRTNLIMKDPMYRKCYQLWKFLESYDEVGYSIEVEDRVLEFDEEYLLQMYTNLITNYTIFKSITEADKRDIEEIPPKKRRIIKPKFAKTVKEEIVDDPTIPYVEVRQVYIDEVTEAQIAAEKKVEELEGTKKELEQDISDLEDRIQLLTGQMNAAIQSSVEASKRADTAERELAESADKLENATKDLRARAETAEAQLKETVETTGKQVSDLENSLKEQTEVREALETKLSAVTSENASVSEKLKAASDELGELKKLHTKSEKEKEALASKLQKSDEKAIKLKEDLKKSAAENSEQAKVDTSLRRELEKSQNAKKNAEEKFARTEEARRELDKRLAAELKLKDKAVALANKADVRSKAEIEARLAAEKQVSDLMKRVKELSEENAMLTEKVNSQSLGKTIAGWIRGNK